MTAKGVDGAVVVGTACDKQQALVTHDVMTVYMSPRPHGLKAAETSYMHACIVLIILLVHLQKLKFMQYGVALRLNRVCLL